MFLSLLILPSVTSCCSSSSSLPLWLLLSSSLSLYRCRRPIAAVAFVLRCPLRCRRRVAAYPSSQLSVVLFVVVTPSPSSQVSVVRCVGVGIAIARCLVRCRCVGAVAPSPLSQLSVVRYYKIVSNLCDCLKRRYCENNVLSWTEIIQTVAAAPCGGWGTPRKSKYHLPPCGAVVDVTTTPNKCKTKKIADTAPIDLPIDLPSNCRRRRSSLLQLYFTARDIPRVVDKLNRNRPKRARCGGRLSLWACTVDRTSWVTSRSTVDGIALLVSEGNVTATANRIALHVYS